MIRHKMENIIFINIQQKFKKLLKKLLLARGKKKILFLKLFLELSM